MILISNYLHAALRFKPQTLNPQLLILSLIPLNPILKNIPQPQASTLKPLTLITQHLTLNPKFF